MGDDEKIIRPNFTAPRDPNAPDVGIYRGGRKLRAKPRCDHPQVEIHERTLDVTCIHCDAPVNPAMVLLRIARGEMRLKYNEQIKAELDKAVAKVKAEVAKLKAQERRLRPRRGEL